MLSCKKSQDGFAMFVFSFIIRSTVVSIKYHSIKSRSINCKDHDFCEITFSALTHFNINIVHCKKNVKDIYVQQCRILHQDLISYAVKKQGYPSH